MMLLQDLKEKKLINPPKFLSDNTHYLVEMGSVAYGVAGESSDCDLYGFCIPPKHITFPHFAGVIYGFDSTYEKFDQWQQHGVIDQNSGQEYDFAIYNIVKYFKLCMDNNPNMVDSLFVPTRNVLHCTSIGTMIRDNKKIFLHKGCWPKFKGYAYQQLHKLKTKSHKFLPELISFENENNIPHSTTMEQVSGALMSINMDGSISYNNLSHLDYDTLKEYHKLYSDMIEKGKRSERVKIHGMDSKFAYHVYRLIGEVEQILREGDLTLDRKDRREVMKAIRAGEWTEDRLKDYFQMKEKQLEELYDSSTIPYSPPVDDIRNLLFECLEHHYGSISQAVTREDVFKRSFREVCRIVDENREFL